jgi:hypothetical protein
MSQSQTLPSKEMMLGQSECKVWYTPDQKYHEGESWKRKIPEYSFIGKVWLLWLVLVLLLDMPNARCSLLFNKLLNYY